MACKISDVIRVMEQHFPPYLAQDWDHVGLQVGDPRQTVSKVCLALDLTEEVLDQAIAEGAQMIITHHPLFFKAINCIDYRQPMGQILERLVKADMTVYSAHTNLDAGERGLNQYLAERLGLSNIGLLDQEIAEDYQKLVVYVPRAYEEKVRAAICSAGAGSIGRYCDCSFRVPGTGTFRPGKDTNPFIGQQGRLEEVDEYRLETIIPVRYSEQIIRSLLKVHPYEEAAYDIYPLENVHKYFSLGRTGSIEQITLEAFARKVKQCLGIDHLQLTGEPEQKVSKAAVVSGAGANFMRQARNRGCDVLVTGDLKYHEAMMARDLGIAIIDAGHQGTERIVGELLQDLLRDSDLEIETFVAKQSVCMRIL